MLVGLVWNPLFPINKNLWTSSFALFSGGIAAQALAICHWAIDVERWGEWWEPLIAFGRNPLAAYFLSVGLDAGLSRWTLPDAPSLKAAIFERGFDSWLRPCCGADAASLAYALAYVGLWGVVLTAMYRRRIFIGI
jgi:predicted acyltransferase